MCAQEVDTGGWMDAMWRHAWHGWGISSTHPFFLQISSPHCIHVGVVWVWPVMAREEEVWSVKSIVSGCGWRDKVSLCAHW